LLKKKQYNIQEYNFSLLFYIVFFLFFIFITQF